jgi:hypothetical protein
MGSIALLVLVCTSSWLLLPHPAAAATAPKLPVRAVNLGGWLVTEGWIKPSLFYGIPNNDTMVYYTQLVPYHRQALYMSLDMLMSYVHLYICRMEPNSSSCRSPRKGTSLLTREGAPPSSPTG